jgi:uncharacterized membrane protein
MPWNQNLPFVHSYTLFYSHDINRRSVMITITPTPSNHNKMLRDESNTRHNLVSIALPLLPKQNHNHPLSTTVLSLTKSEDDSNRIDNDPDPALLISSQPDHIQQLVFFGSFVLLGIGTKVCIDVWNGYGIEVLGTDFYNSIRTFIFPISFGSIFAVVGMTHFIFDTNFIRIVPPKGTWGGLWQAPTPGIEYFTPISYEQYHCYWTGIAELLGGIWLLLSAFPSNPLSTEVPAFLLFLLTIGVTPANIYMFTHNAHPGGIIPKLSYPSGHILRFMIQCGLLSNFWIMSHAPSP